MDGIDTGWVYSDYTALAKKAGGPEELLIQRENVGYELGFSDGMVAGLIVGAGTAALVWAVVKVKGLINARAASKAALTEGEPVKANLMVDRREKSQVEATAAQTMEAEAAKTL